MSDEVTQQLEEASASLLDSKTNVTTALDAASVAVDTAKQRAEAESGKLVPDKVTGTLQNYRFGKFKNEMHPDGNESSPVHVFEVDLGNQVWLHCVIGSDRWDPFVANLDQELVEALESGSSIGELLEGKSITLIRDTGYGRFVPSEMGEAETKGDPIASDASGNNIYKGTTVYSADLGLDLEIVKIDAEGYLLGRRSDGVEGSGEFDEETQKGLTKILASSVSVRQ